MVGYGRSMSVSGMDLSPSAEAYHFKQVLSSHCKLRLRENCSSLILVVHDVAGLVLADWLALQDHAPIAAVIWCAPLLDVSLSTWPMLIYRLLSSQIGRQILWILPNWFVR
jgi:alpha-beta hydrolase superfamily lysophospholipase